MSFKPIISARDFNYLVSTGQIESSVLINANISEENDLLMKRVKKLEAENKTMRECLKFYADEKNWVDTRIRNDFFTGLDLIENKSLFYKGGKKAREVLNKLKEKEK